MSGRGMSSRGRGKSRRPRGNRHISTAEEVMARNAAINNPDREEVEDDFIDEEDSKSDGKLSGEEEEPDDTFSKTVGAAAYIKTCNPNHDKRSVEKKGVQSLSRRERERLQAENYDRIRDKLMAEGKTFQAKADLARLAQVRARREESALKRQMEAADHAKAQAERTEK